MIVQNKENINISRIEFILYNWFFAKFYLGLRINVNI
jgi:hypothetical protein